MLLLAIVRHGEYEGHGNDADPLSVRGHEQMQKIRNIMDAHALQAFKVERPHEVKRLVFSFSSTTRALESTFRLKLAGDDVIVKDLYLAERYEIGQQGPLDIAENVLGLMDHYQAKLGFIVAHGDMPAVLAETFVKMATGQGWDLGSPEKGHGFLVDTDTGHVMGLSAEGLRALPAPNPSPKSPLKPMHRVPQSVPAAAAQAAATVQPEKVREGPPGSLFDEEDDDIPF